MKTVEVNTSTPYRVLIGKDLLPEAGAYIRQAVKPCRAALITDDIVDGLYGRKTEEALLQAGFSVCRFVFPNGEASKNATVYIDILEFLARGYQVFTLVYSVGEKAKEFRPLPHRMDHGRLPPLDGQTLATYKDSTRS